ncbi:MAG: sialate O-acetylesterase [Arachidicoccus sp.]|nr:sialate O-acetylesterase [Arachidicoccus sp.]
MVLQNNAPVPIWGKATNGEKIIVSFAGQTKQVTADASGNWKVVLDKLKIYSSPRDLIIKGDKDKNTIILHNVLVGEVWLCSGQSNMEYTMRKNSKVAKLYNVKGFEHSPVDELKYAHNKNIRIFLGDRKQLAKDHPLHDGWSVAEDSALRSFSAAGYFFARELYRNLNIPIGIISSSVPGSAIEPWFAGELTDSPYVGHTATFDMSNPGKFYTSLIEPLSPFAIKGFLWYQGETNCFQNESIGYTYKMKALIEQWRTLWNNQTLPFYCVQIAPYYYSKAKGKYSLNKETLPKFWEAQSMITKVPYADFITGTDLPDDVSNLHPSGKWEIGRRLAYLALAHDYHKKVIAHGPAYKSMSVKKNKLILKFNTENSKLISKNNKPLINFEISDKSGKYYKADAKIISDNTIELTSINVDKPVNARFAWDEAAQPNLFNEAGLPAIPFRTDNPYADIKL